MKKILFIDACVRPESRTRELAQFVLSGLEGEVTRLDVQEEKIFPLDRNRLEKRMDLLEKGRLDDPMLRYARQFAQADTIVMASPYWDLSFAAELKAYIENICVIGVTFAYNEKDQPYSLCKAQSLLFVTTAGGPILSDAYGFGYIKAVGTAFFQIPDIRQLKAEGLDLAGADPAAILEEAKRSWRDQSLKL